MIITNQARRLVLTKIFSSVCVVALLPGCGADDSENQDAIERILSRLRYQGVAAHLGRLEVESRPELQSVTLEQLAADILSAIDLDINAIDDTQIDSIHERLSRKVRQDFADESVTAVDGWLLSLTEANVCVLVYLNIAQPSA